MLEEIKQFISKWIKNPIVIGIVAYIIYKTLKNYVRTESFGNNENKRVDSVKVLEVKGNEEVIYDEDTKMYALIKGHEILETSNNPIKFA